MNEASRRNATRTTYEACERVGRSAGLQIHGALPDEDSQMRGIRCDIDGA